MSVEKNSREAKRWMRTARYDLETAEILLDNNRYAHCCFLSQQSAEKALKAIYYLNDEDGWGHSVLNLIDEIKEVDKGAFSMLVGFRDDAVVLDKFYIPTRYPNGLPDITPDAAYTQKEAKEGIRIAREICDAATRIIEEKRNQ